MVVWHARSSCRGQQKLARENEAGVLRGALRDAGVPRLSRRLCGPRHPGGACYRTLHSRLWTRPRTQSWVGLAALVRGGRRRL